MVNTELVAKYRYSKKMLKVSMILVQRQSVFTVQSSMMDSQDFRPSEEEQYEAYKAVLEGMNGKPVVAHHGHRR